MDIVEQIDERKTASIAKWTNTVTTEVDRIFAKYPDLTQLQATRVISQELHNLLNSYPGTVSIRVNPKGNKEIQIILIIEEVDGNPSIKIKPRFLVPSTTEVDA